MNGFAKSAVFQLFWDHFHIMKLVQHKCQNQLVISNIKHLEPKSLLFLGVTYIHICLKQFEYPFSPKSDSLQCTYDIMGCAYIHHDCKLCNGHWTRGHSTCGWLSLDFFALACNFHKNSGNKKLQRLGEHTNSVQKQIYCHWETGILGNYSIPQTINSADKIYFQITFLWKDIFFWTSLHGNYQIGRLPLIKQVNECTLVRTMTKTIT